MKKLQIPIGWKKNNCFAYCILFQSKFGCAEIIKCKIHIFLDSKPVWIVYEINLQIKLNDILGKFFKQEKENIRNDYSIEIWKKNVYKMEHFLKSMYVFHFITLTNLCLWCPLNRQTFRPSIHIIKDYSCFTWVHLLLQFCPILT